MRLTDSAPVELHSHRDVSVPSPWMYSDILSSNSRNERVRHYRVAVTVSTEVLKYERYKLSLPSTVSP